MAPAVSRRNRNTAPTAGRIRKCSTSNNGESSRRRSPKKLNSTVIDLSHNWKQICARAVLACLLCHRLFAYYYASHGRSVDVTERDRRDSPWWSGDLCYHALERGARGSG